MPVEQLRAPSGATEREQQVLELFRRTLSRDDIGLDDDFFELGGDSFAATRIVARLYDLWGADFQQDVLFRCPTPRELAQAVAGDTVDLSLSASLVPLNDVLSGDPIYLVHDASANPWVFRPLVEHAALSRPAYALRPPDLDWDRDVLTLPQLVQHYATEIRRVQRRGPYSIAGYGLGGTLAFEIATRLAADGQQVRHLVMIDTPAPTSWWSSAPARAANAILRGICRLGRIGAAVLDVAGVLPARRALFCFGAGPLTPSELRSVLTVACRVRPERRELTFAELCCAAEARLGHMSMAGESGAPDLSGARADAVTPVRAYKIWAKNQWLAGRHRIRTVFPGTLTIFASDSDRTVARWRRFVSQPIDVRRVPIDPRAPARPLLLNPATAALFATDFSHAMEP